MKQQGMSIPSIYREKITHKPNFQKKQQWFIITANLEAFKSLAKITKLGVTEILVSTSACIYHSFSQNLINTKEYENMILKLYRTA